MAIDSSSRKLLQQTVTEMKKLLEKEFLSQLQSIYGIQENGESIPLEKMTHLADEDFTIARIVRERISHLEPYVKKNKKEALLRVVRESAFTVLNRFAALRMAEARNIVRPCIAGGAESEGFKLYDMVAGSSLGNTYEKYRAYLLSLFDELSQEMGVLFDRFSPSGMLFPGEQTLFELVKKLQNKELEQIWQEDETIGWIYQYFNSPDERKAMRKASSAPRDSRELAVRNQFFTPRYVVRFLVDNTVGRLWYGMTEGKTKLSDFCEYMVKEPPEEVRRGVKDPREIKIMDPACGSMHFGLYCFDVLEKIYEEGWDFFPELFKDLREKIEDKNEFLKLVPNFIVEHNLHGIDIDQRAVQIAGLSLWLRAQRSYTNLGLTITERPTLTKTNIVCAEPMPGERDMLEEFKEGLKPAVLGDLLSFIWDEMKLAGEVGSLLKIEDTLSTQLKKAKTAWNVYTKDMQRYVQGDLFEKDRQMKLKEMLGFDISDIDNLEEWQGMEAKLLSALSEYAGHAEKADAYRRKLFAEDAASGFAFIDVCRNRYDAVLMNPPFGDAAKGAKKYIQDHYPRTKNDLYAAFVESFIHRLVPGGMLGAITSRTGFFLSSFQTWREEILLKEARPTVFADLGFGVLDAMVETAAYCLEKVQKAGNDRLAKECEKLDPKEERALAEEGMYFEAEQWD